MFENLNFWEVGVLVLLALFIFGPERLPKVIGDGLRMLRNLRDMARNATNDLSRELGTEVTIEDLHPKTFIRKHLLSEQEQQELLRPVDQVFRDVKQITADANGYRVQPLAQPPAPRSPDGQPRPYDGSARTYDDPGRPQDRQGRPQDGTSRPYESEPRPFDSDAT